MKVPNGHQQGERPWKVGVLSVCTEAGPWPVLWNSGRALASSDLALGRPLAKLARKVWGAGGIRWLILEAGFVDGPWIRWMRERGTDTIIRLREGMDNHEAALGAAARVPAQAWQSVPLPKRRKGRPLPLHRDLLGLPDQPGGESLGLSIALCLMRDT